MAELEEGLVAFIETNVPSAGKGYPLMVPQGLSGWAYQDLPGIGNQLSHGGRTGFVFGRMQITITGSGDTPYNDVKLKARAVREALDGFKGTMGAVFVEYCHVRNIEDDWAEAQKLPVQRLDIKINYRK